MNAEDTMNVRQEQDYDSGSRLDKKRPHRFKEERDKKLPRNDKSREERPWSRFATVKQNFTPLTMPLEYVLHEIKYDPDLK